MEADPAGAGAVEQGGEAGLGERSLPCRIKIWSARSCAGQPPISLGRWSEPPPLGLHLRESRRLRRKADLRRTTRRPLFCTRTGRCLSCDVVAQRLRTHTQAQPTSLTTSNFSSWVHSSHSFPASAPAAASCGDDVPSMLERRLRNACCTVRPASLEQAQWMLVGRRQRARSRWRRDQNAVGSPGLRGLSSPRHEDHIIRQ